MKKSNNKKGFTLVEVIVVLVILAILAAILVPALTGYIDKANDKAAITEAGSVVVACQTVGSEAYGSKVRFGGDSAKNFLTEGSGKYYKEAMELAELETATGGPEITSITFSAKNKVTNMEFTSSAGKKVTYDGKNYTVAD